MLLNLAVFCYIWMQGLVLTSSCGVQIGYWGESCDRPCEIRCIRGCDSRTGKCAACFPGFWGDFCNFQCPHNCQWYCYHYSYYVPLYLEALQTSYGIDKCGARCNQLNGECYRCEDEHLWSTSCNQSCSKSNFGCDLCDITGQCKQCLPGFQCQLASTSCPAHCISCSSSTKICYSCTQGFWGQNCTKSCRAKNCLDANCDKDTGLCRWCEDGWWGSNCTLQCSLRNCRHCRQDTGICDLCKDGFWGTECETSCSVGCADNRCEKIEGKCAPCKWMFWGDACNSSCFIENCEIMIGCPRDLGPSCFKCTTGKWGERCTKQCQKNCTNGCKIDTGECNDAEKLAERTTTALVTETNSETVKLTEQPDIKLIVGVSVGCSVVVFVILQLVTAGLLRVYRLRKKPDLPNLVQSDVNHAYENTKGLQIIPDEMGHDIHDKDNSRQRRDNSGNEQRLKQKKDDKPKRKKIEKEEHVLNQEVKKSNEAELYEILDNNKTDSLEAYESLQI